MTSHRSSAHSLQIYQAWLRARSSVKKRHDPCPEIGSHADTNLLQVTPSWTENKWQSFQHSTWGGFQLGGCRMSRASSSLIRGFVVWLSPVKNGEDQVLESPERCLLKPLVQTACYPDLISKFWPNFLLLYQGQPCLLFISGIRLVQRISQGSPEK